MAAELILRRKSRTDVGEAYDWYERCLVISTVLSRVPSKDPLLLAGRILPQRQMKADVEWLSGSG